MVSEEEVLVKHKKELKELNAKVMALKKQVTKGDKKKKKDITKEIESLEKEVKDRHKLELESTRSAQDNSTGTKESNGGDNNGTENLVQSNTDNDENADDAATLAEQLLAEMSLDAEPEPVPEPEQPVRVVGGATGSKRNRRKEKLLKREAQNQELYQEALNEAAIMPDLRGQELETITALCDKQGLVQHEIAADGHCLFASISDQLAIRHGIKVSVQELRKIAANYIRENSDTFSPFLFDENTLQLRDITEYTNDLETTALWGGDMEILALSKVYNCPISVLFSSRPVHLVNDSDTSDSSGPILKLVYYKHSFALGEHYSSLRDKPEAQA